MRLKMTTLKKKKWQHFDSLIDKAIFLLCCKIIDLTGNPVGFINTWKTQGLGGENE